MTPSNDLILDPGYWLANPEKEHMLRLHIFEAMLTKPLDPLDPPKYDPESVTEPESDLDIPLKPQTLLQPLICDPESVTEPESDLDVPPEASNTPAVLLVLISYCVLVAPHLNNVQPWPFNEVEKGVIDARKTMWDHCYNRLNNRNFNEL
ncbi:hypothetical protein EDD22DRAFT_854194 [Suillus occidentalis]|nr:hypothetical protein EDD22DRAFT_854194 [Suillus occidentalis]